VNVSADVCPEQIGLTTVKFAVGLGCIVNATFPATFTTHGFAPPFDTFMSAYVVAELSAAVAILAVPAAESVII
jgi:hypothetical protein